MAWNTVSDDQGNLALLSSFGADTELNRQRKREKDMHFARQSSLEAASVGERIESGQDPADYIRQIMKTRIENGQPVKNMSKLLNMVTSGDINGAQQLSNSLHQDGIRAGLVDTPKSEQRPIISGEQGFHESLTKNLSPEDRLAADRIKLRLDPPAALTGEERIAQDAKLSQQVADAEELQAAAKETGKGSAQRTQVSINSGVDAAKGIGLLNRTIGLLDELETGGRAAVALRAKQYFGVEGADEAELSANVGKAVLSQLRTVFGAAFTAQEGEKLTEIEANIGKSTEGNKRLLNQGLQLAMRAAKRGQKAAVGSGDYRTAADIEDLINFKLEDEAMSSMFNSSQQEALPDDSSVLEKYGL